MSLLSGPLNVSVTVPGLTLAEGQNYAFGTTTGTKFGTATSQKIGFWNATPVIQQANAAQAAVTMGVANGAIAALTSSATTTQAEFNALRDLCETLRDDVAAVNVLLTRIRLDLVTIGMIKGAA